MPPCVQSTSSFRQICAARKAPFPNRGKPPRYARCSSSSAMKTRVIILSLLAGTSAIAQTVRSGVFTNQSPPLLFPQTPITGFEPPPPTNLGRTNIFGTNRGPVFTNRVPGLTNQFPGLTNLPPDANLPPEVPGLPGVSPKTPLPSPGLPGTTPGLPGTTPGLPGNQPGVNQPPGAAAPGSIPPPPLTPRPPAVPPPATPPRTPPPVQR